VQLRRWLPPTALGLGLCAAWASPSAAFLPLDDQTAGTLLRWFTDSDEVAVRSMTGAYAFSLPRGTSLDFHWNHERVTIPGVAAPVGSQEAVDAITTASRPIAGNAYQDFVKVRNEFEGTLARGRVAVDYYLSSESDYLGQMLGARVNRDLLGDQLNLSLGSSYGWDAIDPLADDDTQTGRDRKTTLHVNAVATRIVTATTLVRVGVEMNLVDGLQHNPYRNVYAGGTNVTERHPDRRQRRDAFLKLNQYLPNRSSVRFAYRFYSDDWGIDSHEIGSTLHQYLTHGAFARWQYRWYTQTAADFWRDEYLAADGVDGYRSGDYRTGPLSSHLFGVALNLDLAELAPESAALRPWAVWLSVDRYFNSNNYSANILETGLDFRF
jgi:hypothetical protein